MNNRIIGILGIILGLLIIIVFYIFLSKQNSNFINYNSEILTVKYFLPILFINGAFYFIGFGILNFLGFLKPYFSDDIDDYDKAKNYLFSITFTIPIWASGTILVLNIIDHLWFNTLWFLIIIGICISLIFNIKIIKKRRRHGTKR